jgi:predicted ATPase/DNA-binding SARP family transcriptional activator
VSDDGGVLITTLGPLAVDGQPVKGDRLAAVIRELVDARGRTVSTGALIDVVWSGAPPDDARKAVQALVGRVRRLGVPVLAAPGGYQIPADEVEIDAVTARVLVDRGRQALAARDAAGARNRADRARAVFPDVPELAEPGIARLFSDVVTLQAEVALSTGGPFDEADLRRLSARTPPDEPAAALLVRVLAAQGRDAEALETVEHVRTELSQRYGADPSPVLTEAHLALLRGQLVAARPRMLADLPAGWRRAATPLVGRDEDVAAIGRVLPAAPLVTIVAAGGAGKTRLAAEIARSVSESRPVQVVELAGLRTPAEVLPAVLAVLPGAEAGSLEAVDADFDGLLILDNCEHVLDTVAAIVTDLLAVVSPRFSVLATSRAPLSLVGEVVYRLPALPDDSALVLLEARVRAGGTAPNWDRDHAVTLCRRLDNLPLALELAAARLRFMPIDDVLAGLNGRFALLDDALRGLPDRHAGLWALTDWSRKLLDPAEQALLDQLAVIAAPFTADLVQAVVGGTDVRRGLSILAEQSLLYLDDGRYRMLETVREYGEARLDAAAGRETAMTGLVRWARERAVALTADFVGLAQIEALNDCAADQDNLVAALRWALDHDDEPAAVDIAAALVQLWTVRGQHVEASTWARSLFHLDDLVARRRSAILNGRITGRAMPHADRLAWLCVLVGLNAGITGTYRLNALARRALRTLLAERPSDISPRIAALAAALPGFGQADPDTSLADTATLITHPDPYVQAMGYFIRAVLGDNGGTRHNAPGDGELAYRRFEAIGDHWGMGMAAHAAGHATDAGGRHGNEWLRRSEQHLKLVGAAEDARSTRVLLDAQLALAGDIEAERRLREIARSDNYDGTDVCQTHLVLAQVAWRNGRPDEALTHTNALLRAAATVPGPGPAPSSTLFRSAAVVIDLWIAGANSARATVASGHDRALDTLRYIRADVQVPGDRPLLRAWAMGGAELAALRGDIEKARNLWALGTRVSANISRFFPQGQGTRLQAALGDRENRELLLAEAGRLTRAIVCDRLHALMEDLLA